MSRDLPSYCEHGKVMDWGDFGDDPEFCTDCDHARAIRWAKAVERMRLTLSTVDRTAIAHAEDELLYVLGLPPAPTTGENR